MKWQEKSLQCCRRLPVQTDRGTRVGSGCRQGAPGPPEGQTPAGAPGLQGGRASFRHGMQGAEAVLGRWVGCRLDMGREVLKPC